MAPKQNRSGQGPIGAQTEIASRPVMDNDLATAKLASIARAINSGDRTIVFFMLLVALYVMVALLAPVLAPSSPGDQDLMKRFLPPLSQGYPLGTDSLGRDILSRLIYGARISLGVGSVVVVLAGIVGTIFGLWSGYWGGVVDDFVSWLVNVHLAFPFVLLAISVVVVLGPSLLNVIVVLTITGWPSYARLIRSKVLELRGIEFVEAARSIGASRYRIIGRHILPNVVSSLIVLSTLELAKVVIAEAALSFLGLGPSGLDYSSWGLMLAEGKDYLSVAWWVATIPGLTIMMTVLSVNVVGDWLRDRLDPRMRQ